MNAKENFFQGIALPYLTGMLGGLLYLIRIVMDIFLWTNGRFSNQTIIGSFVFFLMMAPVFCSLALGEFFIELIPGPANELSAAIQVIIISMAFIMVGFLFAGLGYMAGKRMNDPKQERLKQRVLVLLCSVISIVCMCYAGIIAIATHFISP